MKQTILLLRLIVGLKISSRSIFELFFFRAAVELTARDHEVMGSNPGGCWAFFSLSSVSVMCP